jgi:hypothetical protein
MSKIAAATTQNHAQPLSPPTVHRTSYSRVASGKKMRPSRGKMNVSKAPSGSLQPADAHVGNRDFSTWERALRIAHLALPVDGLRLQVWR